MTMSIGNLSLSLAPFVAWPIWVLLFAVGALLVGFMAFNRMRGGALRALVFILLMTALANPLLRQDERQSLRDIAVIIVDDSLSTLAANRRAQQQAALSKLKDNIAALGNIDVRVEHVTSGTTAETDGTRMFAALDRAKTDIPPDRYAGAFFLTDGQVHDAPERLESTAPLHVLLSGSKSDIDRRIVIDQVPRFAIAGEQTQKLSFHVEDNGSTRLQVTATLPDDTIQMFDVLPGELMVLEFKIAHAGQNIIELRVEPQAGEISIQNNRALAVVEGVRDRLRVMLVSGQPHVGERTWRNLLKSDASVDLVHFTILRPPEKQDGTPTKELSLIAFPTRELFLDKIQEFDLVIFDRYQREAILPDAYLENVADYVRGGGAVLVASGPDFASIDGLASTPLAAILPALPTGNIATGGFKPKVTDIGRKHPITANLPGDSGDNATEPSWGRWFRSIDATVADAKTVLMTAHDGKPLVVTARVGEGRVVQVLSDHGWLWVRGFEGGGPQMELLRRVAHWQMKEPDLEEEALRASQDGQALVIERRTLADQPSEVTVTLPSGKTEVAAMAEVEPGLFRGRIDVTESGLHRLNDATLRSVAAVGSADAKEMANLQATPSVVAPLVAASGGAISWLEDGLPRLSKQVQSQSYGGTGWAALRDNQQFRVTAVREVPLFATLLSLAAVLIGLASMWYREGR
jgi:hypothetical protein